MQSRSGKAYADLIPDNNHHGRAEVLPPPAPTAQPVAPPTINTVDTLGLVDPRLGQSNRITIKSSDNMICTCAVQGNFSLECFVKLQVQWCHLAIVQPLALLQPASVPEPLQAVGPQVKQTQVDNAKIDHLN